MPANSATISAPAPVRSPFLTALVGWLIPGAGHFLLGRRGRGAIIFATVLAAFLIGILLRGSMFVPGGNGMELNGAGTLTATTQVSGGGDVLSRLIQYGGFIGDAAAGLPYLLTSFLGYLVPDQAGHDADYGSKFLVAAGLLNILAIVDAYEIATRQKD
jgi:TM2 domain-containing membrane protein YozV